MSTENSGTFIKNINGNNKILPAIKEKEVIVRVSISFMVSFFPKTVYKPKKTDAMSTRKEPKLESDNIVIVPFVSITKTPAIPMRIPINFVKSIFSWSNIAAKIETKMGLLAKITEQVEAFAYKSPN
jgi:hypothetical protein